MTYELIGKDKNQSFRIVLPDTILDISIRTYKGVSYLSLIADEKSVYRSRVIIDGASITPNGRLRFHDIDGMSLTTDRFDGISCWLEYEE